ncbi:hypothetical protein [Pustulibacterium marinum]|uniref:hypothetical protein n=1 Tax=Pustulibacterium marinum TaxID=1224947 RepID=UPI001160CC7D|nr:hypothetical protein [Pustulibacterium marinum]
MLGGEDCVLRGLQRKYPDYEFVLFNDVEISAAVLGYKDCGGFLHYAVYQVYVSDDQPVPLQRITLPNGQKRVIPYDMLEYPHARDTISFTILTDVIRGVFNHMFKGRLADRPQVLVTIGYTKLIYSHGTYTLLEHYPKPKIYTLHGLKLNKPQKVALQQELHGLHDGCS